MQISVVIPTYNRYEVLKRAILSVIAQTYRAAEIIVIDDGSTDETLQIIEEFPDIRYFYQENAGVSGARNLGIQKATYEWIAFLDSDDEWHENKLQEHLQLHMSRPKLEMSYTDEKWIRGTKEVKLPKKYRKFGGNIFEECLSHCIIAPSATLIHRKLLDRVGLFDESLEVCEDYDLWLRVAYENEIGLINKKLITKYGGDEDQLSVKFWGMDRFRVKALEKLFILYGSKNKIIKSTLMEKYRLLLKGAIKYDKMQDIKLYEKRLKELNE
jgi:glycosyltransferase involved in cell wall biosynthesis